MPTSTPRSATRRTRRRAPLAPVEHDPELSDVRAALALVFGPTEDRRFAVRYWNGVIDAPDDPTPAFTLTLGDAGALRRMLLPPSELRLAESFIRGDFGIEGSLEAAAALSDSIRSNVTAASGLARLTRLLLALPSAEPAAQQERDARDDPARSHYDVDNDFYALWLDSRMVYSCAYFRRANDGLDQAQEAKLDYICRKLRLQPGDALLDIGCGWGSLVMHAVEKYGVTALGVTLSYDQASIARDRVRERGLGERCSIEVRDYRHLPQDEGFDKISSVGMVEHVGVNSLPAYFEHTFGLLKPGGLFLNQGITHAPERSRRTLASRVGGVLWGEGEFIDRYVFPRGEIPTLAQIITSAENAGFETRDIESLREHYALTLRHWIKRLESCSDEAIGNAGERIYRIWRLYMSSAAHGFACGRLGLDQTLLAKQFNGSVSLPLTREDLY